VIALALAGCALLVGMALAFAVPGARARMAVALASQGVAVVATATVVVPVLAGGAALRAQVPWSYPVESVTVVVDPLSAFFLAWSMPLTLLGSRLRDPVPRGDFDARPRRGAPLRAAQPAAAVLPARSTAYRTRSASCSAGSSPRCARGCSSSGRTGSRRPGSPASTTSSPPTSACSCSPRRLMVLRARVRRDVVRRVRPCVVRARAPARHRVPGARRRVRAQGRVLPGPHLAAAGPRRGPGPRLGADVRASSTRRACTACCGSRCWPGARSRGWGGPCSSSGPRRRWSGRCSRRRSATSSGCSGTRRPRTSASPPWGSGSATLGLAWNDPATPPSGSRAACCTCSTTRWFKCLLFYVRRQRVPRGAHGRPRAARGPGPPAPALDLDVRARRGRGQPGSPAQRLRQRVPGVLGAVLRGRRGPARAPSKGRRWSASPPCLAFVGALSAFALVRAFGIGFLGTPREPAHPVGGELGAAAARRDVDLHAVAIVALVAWSRRWAGWWWRRWW
jgi:hypothetical protein